MYKACREGDVEFVKFVLSKGNIERNTKIDCIKKACLGGHLEIYKLLEIENDLFNFFHYACKGGNIELIEYMLSKGINPSSGIKGACLGGNMNIVKFLISKGAMMKNCLSYACVSGNIEIVKLCLEDEIEYGNNAFIGACESGNMDIVNLLIEKGGYRNWEDGIKGACAGGKIDVAKYIVSKSVKEGTAKFNIALSEACKNGHADLALYMIDCGADDLEYGFESACRYGQLELAKSLYNESYKVENSIVRLFYSMIYIGDREGNVEGYVPTLLYLLSLVSSEDANRLKKRYDLDIFVKEYEREKELYSKYKGYVDCSNQ
jgi:hypothetical protein